MTALRCLITGKPAATGTARDGAPIDRIRTYNAVPDIHQETQDGYDQHPCSGRYDEAVGVDRYPPAPLQVGGTKSRASTRSAQRLEGICEALAEVDAGNRIAGNEVLACLAGCGAPDRLERSSPSA